MNSKKETRALVERAYTEAITKRGGCCTPASEREGVPSFGCGNPLAFADVQPGQIVLDLGSGAGHDLLFAAEAVGPQGRVIGVDMTDAMLAAAREHTRGHGNIEVRKGIIEELPVEDASVDWVISNCVINLSPDKPRVFAEIRRVLRPGGRFSISDIVARGLPDWLRTSGAAYSACVAGAIAEDEYVAGLAAAGLEEIEVAERHPYSVDEVCGLAAGEFGMDVKPADVAGIDVASVRITGRRPL